MSIEEKVIDEIDSLRKGFDQLSTDMSEISKELTELRGEMLKISKNLDKTAKKSEVKELESLLDIYNPIKANFVTRDEVNRLLQEKIGKR